MSRIEYLAEGVTLYLGDCRDVMREFEPDGPLPLFAGLDAAE